MEAYLYRLKIFMSKHKLKMSGLDNAGYRYGGKCVTWGDINDLWNLLRYTYV